MRIAHCSFADLLQWLQRSEQSLWGDEERGQFDKREEAAAGERRRHRSLAGGHSALGGDED